MSGPPLDLRPRVRSAIAAGRPVVALESTVIAHGLPRPRSLEVAGALEEAVRAEGAEPATVGLLDGRAVVGLSSGELERFATGEGIAKASLRDLGTLVAAGTAGATTVAATAHLAARAGIRVLSTGGIGGVHRDVERSFDISADVTALARMSLVVVCSGAKSVLDLPRTLEALETLGVPVVGYRTAELPAFYARESGCGLELRADGPERVAALFAAQRALGVRSAVVVARPPPEGAALPREEVEGWVRRAEQEARDAGVRGNALTPWLLERLAALSGGRTVETNVALLLANARLAARIAGALASC